MDDKKNKKRQKKRVQKIEPSEGPSVVLSRRRLLKGAVLAIAGALVLGGGSAFYHFFSKEIIDPFDSAVLIYNRSTPREILLEHSVPFIDPKKLLQSDPEEGRWHNDLESTLRSVLRKDSQLQGVEYTILTTVESRIVPLQENLVKPLVAYHQKAINFLYEQLPELTRYTPHFVPVTQRGDLHLGRNVPGSIYLGNIEFSVYRAYAIVPDGSPLGKKMVIPLEHNKLEAKVIGRFTKTDVSEGAFMHSSSTNPDFWFVFSPAGPAALRSMFSELIPLSTRQVWNDPKYVSIDTATRRTIDETFEEAASTILGEELVIREHIFRGKEYLREVEQHTKDEVYQYVPQAVAWMKSFGNPIDGIKMGLRLYRQNPLFFLETVKKK